MVIKLMLILPFLLTVKWTVSQSNSQIGIYYTDKGEENEKNKDKYKT